jgi:hypothetical protein
MKNFNKDNTECVVEFFGSDENLNEIQEALRNDEFQFDLRSCIPLPDTYSNDSELSTDGVRMDDWCWVTWGVKNNIDGLVTWSVIKSDEREEMGGKLLVGFVTEGLPDRALDVLANKFPFVTIILHYTSRSDYEFGKYNVKSKESGEILWKNGRFYSETVRAEPCKTPLAQ